MALTALEIEAIFRLETGPVLQAFTKIAEEARLLEKELKRIATDTGAAFGTAFQAMGAGISAQIIQVNALAAAWGNVGVAAKAAAAAAATPTAAAPIASAAKAAAAAATAVPTLPLPAVPAVPGVGRGGGHGGGGAPGVSLYPSGIPVPGGHAHVRYGSNVATAGALAAGYGVGEAFEMGDIVSRGLANVFQGGAPEDREKKANELEEIILKEAQITGLPLGTVSKMALDEIRTNANQPWEARMKVMPTLIEHAAREAYTKGSTPQASMEALVGMTHQLGAFSPEEIDKVLPALTYFLSKDPNSVTRFVKSAGYHTTIARTLMNIDPAEDLAAQVVLDRTGVGGKSGTWLREMMVRAVPPLPTDMSPKAKWRREQLKNLGLMDEAGKTTILRDDGTGFSEQKMLHILSDKIGKMPIEERTERLRVFGERGRGAVANLVDPTLLGQYDVVRGEIKGLQPTTEFWKEQNKLNPMQQAKGSWVELQTVLLEIGKVALPAVVSALKTFNEVLKTFRANLPGDEGKNIGYGAVAGAIAGGIRGARHGVAGAVLGAAGGATGGVGLTTVPAAAYEAIKEGTFWDRFKKWMMPGGGGAFNAPLAPIPGLLPASHGGRVPGMIGPMVPFGNFGPRPPSFNDRFGSFGSPPSPGSIAPGAAIGDMSSTHQKAITISTNLNIDGRTLASIVTEHQVGGGDTSGGTYGPGNAQYSAS